MSNMKFISHICNWQDYIAITIIANDGTASCRLHIYNDEQDVAIISDLYVNFDKRRNGIATELLNYSIKCAKEQGCSKISLRSDNNDFVRKWYQKLGFEEISSQIWFEKQLIK